MTADTYAGIPVRRGLFQCADWQRMAEDLLAFQDAVQEALRTEEAGHVLGAIERLRGRELQRARIRKLVAAGVRNEEIHRRSAMPLLEAAGFTADQVREIIHAGEEAA